MLEDCYSWLDGYCLGREKLLDFFLRDASTSLELLIALQAQQQSRVSSASEMTGSFQTEWGIAFFPVPVLLCPGKQAILKSPTGHLFATLFLAVLHPSCPKIESAQSSKSILRGFL